MRKISIWVIVLSFLCTVQLEAKKYYEVFPAGAESSGESALTLEGWGPGGLFAYSKKIDNSWIPSYGEQYVIYDLVNDKVVWETSYEIQGGEEESEETIKQAYRDKIKTGTQGYRIANFDSELCSASEIQPLPYYEGNDTLKVYLEIGDYSSEDGFCTTYHAYHYTVWAEKGGKKKQISSGDTTFAISQTILGYYKHPNENRLAVIVSIYHAGLECESYMETLIIGCHTSAGFK